MPRTHVCADLRGIKGIASASPRSLHECCTTRLGALAARNGFCTCMCDGRAAHSDAG